MKSKELKELRAKVKNLREAFELLIKEFSLCEDNDSYYLHWDVRNNVSDGLFRAASGLHALWATEVEREKRNKHENS